MKAGDVPKVDVGLYQLVEHLELAGAGRQDQIGGATLREGSTERRRGLVRCSPPSGLLVVFYKDLHGLSRLSGTGGLTKSVTDDVGGKG